MSKLTGHDLTDTAIVAVAVERSKSAAAARDAEPTEADRAEIARIVAEHGEPA